MTDEKDPKPICSYCGRETYDLHECDVCGNLICSSCVEYCEECDLPVCPDCYDGEMCNKCREELENDDSSED